MASTVCKQCNGNGAMKGQEATIDLSGNTQSFQSPTGQPNVTTCSQCRGTGIQNSFGN